MNHLLSIPSFPFGSPTSFFFFHPLAWCFFVSRSLVTACYPSNKCSFSSSFNSSISFHFFNNYFTDAFRVFVDRTRCRVYDSRCTTPAPPKGFLSEWYCLATTRRCSSLAGRTACPQAGQPRRTLHTSSRGRTHQRR